MNQITIRIPAILVIAMVQTSCLSIFMQPSKEDLIWELAERDPNKAMALYYEKEQDDPFYESDIPEIIMKASAKKGTDEFIEILNHFQFSNDGRTVKGTERCISVEFSKDFDFKRAADETDRLRQKHGAQFPERFPDNFIYEWGKKDFRAADEWTMENYLPFNEQSSLNDAAQKALGTKKAGIWMAQKLESSTGRSREALLEILLGFSTEENIKSVAAAMPNTATRDRFLQDLVSVHIGHYSENCTGVAMSLLSTPAARLTALHKIQSSNDWIPNDQELKSMGITRAQYDEIEKSKKTE
jgi:hypothetical protein